MKGLGRVALVGTEAAGPPPAEGPGVVLLEAREADPPEWRLLLLAGTESLWRQAGRLPDPAPNLPDAAPDDPRPACGRDADDALLDLVRAYPALVPWAVARLQRANLRVPNTSVPRLLDSRHRAELAPVLGTIARWLAARHAGWALPGEVRVDWEEGTLSDRIALLAAARRTDPARGLAWVQTACESERADAREALVSGLAVGLSEADVPLLEQLVASDRSQRVRAVARKLLEALPGTSAAAAALQRALAILAPDGTLTPPRSFDPAWDDLVESAPRGLGKRAWWALQILERVPPPALCEALGHTPASLLAALPDEPVLGYAWTRRGHPAVATALWDWWRDRECPAFLFSERADLAAALGGDEVAERARASLAAGHTVEVGLLARVPVPWPPDLARAWLQWAQNQLKFPRNTDLLAQAEHAAAGLPDDLVAEALQALGTRPHADSSDWHARRLQGELDKLTEALHARARFQRAVPLTPEIP